MNLNITPESALAILGVEPHEAGTAAGINSAFRRAALFCHPDKHGGDAEAARLFRLMVFCRDGLLNGMAAPPPPPTQTAQWVRVDLNRTGWWSANTGTVNF